MKSLFYVGLSIGFLSLTGVSGCRKCTGCENLPPAYNKAPLEIQVVNKVDGNNLQLEPASYTNATGEAYTVGQFTYYLGNFTLTTSTGSEIQLPGAQYFLVDQSKPETMVLKFDSIPNGAYTLLKFTLGVDSVSNSTSAHDGALDPANNMAWNWNTGYVFMRFKGNYTPAGKPTAGYALDMGLNSNLVNYAIPINMSVLAKAQKAKLEFNLAEALKGPHNYSFEHDGDQLHMSISDQYTIGAKLSQNLRDAFTFVVTP